VTARKLDVFRDGTLVLTVRGEPGPLVSVSAPPPLPGEELPAHPFLSASAYVPEYEDELRRALDASADLDDYVARLRAAGYRVAEDPQ
jgi:hypothetical protein